MAVNYFTFNGVSSLSKGLYVSGSGTFDAPEKDYEVVSIPGRSGDLLIDNQRFKNVELVYPAIIIDDYLTNTSNIRNWLLSANGYCRLEDTYHQDEYRIAYFTGPVDIETILLQAGECDIKFKCKPQRFLKSGEILSSIASFPASITNPTPFTSRPTIYIIRTDIYSESSISIGTNGVTISEDCPYKYVTVDSERRSVYGYGTEENMLGNTNGINVSSFVSIFHPDFPTLRSGNTGIGNSITNISSIFCKGGWWIV